MARRLPRKNHYKIEYKLIQPVQGFFSGQVVSYHVATYRRQVRAET